jgi:hypothetical protein
MGLTIAPIYPKVPEIPPVEIPADQVEVLGTATGWDLEYGEVDLCPAAVLSAARIGRSRGLSPDLAGRILTFAAAVERLGYGITLWRATPRATWSLRMSGSPLGAPEVACTASTAYAILDELRIPYDIEQACGRADARTVLVRCQEARRESAHGLWIDQVLRVAEYALSHGIAEIAWA